MNWDTNLNIFVQKTDNWYICSLNRLQKEKNIV